MSKEDKIDERTSALVLEALREHAIDPEAAQAAVMAALLPVMGAQALRRRSESYMMGAFREGFMSGRMAGRMARWHGDIWRASTLFRTMRDAGTAKRDARYDRYNF